MKIKFFALFILILTSTVYSQDVNILNNYNGDFEDGITFWRFFEVPDNIGSTWEITDDVSSGSKAMKITYVAADATIEDI